jgi:hypothetical protein
LNELRVTLSRRAKEAEIARSRVLIGKMEFTKIRRILNPARFLDLIVHERLYLYLEHFISGQSVLETTSYLKRIFSREFADNYETIEFLDIYGIIKAGPDPSIIRCLLKQGADPNVVWPIFLEYSLPSFEPKFAEQAREICKLMLEYGANPYCQLTGIFNKSASMIIRNKFKGDMALELALDSAMKKTEPMIIGNRLNGDMTSPSALDSAMKETTPIIPAASFNGDMTSELAPDSAMKKVPVRNGKRRFHRTLKQKLRSTWARLKSSNES